MRLLQKFAHLHTSDILALWLFMTVRTRKFQPGKLGQALQTVRAGVCHVGFAKWWRSCFSKPLVKLGNDELSNRDYFSSYLANTMLAFIYTKKISLSFYKYEAPIISFFGYQNISFVFVHKKLSSRIAYKHSQLFIVFTVFALKVTPSRHSSFLTWPSEL